MSYMKPYDVPDLANISVKDIEINFEKEKAFVQKSKEGTEQKPTDTNPDDLLKLSRTNATNLYSILSELSSTDQIKYLKEAIVHSPDNHVLLNRLRIDMLKNEQTEEYIIFIKGLEESNVVKLHLALAYVDLLQDVDLGTAALGQRSSQSILILTEILEDNPNNLLARYARGVNNLYWPSGLQRTEKAIQDLAFCVAVAEKFPDENFPLYESFYITYGDALMKEGKIKEGRAVWKKGLKQFSSSKELETRNSSSEQQAMKIVEESRGIDIFQRPDELITDLQVLWEK